MGAQHKRSPPYSKKGSKFQMTDKGRKEEEGEEEEEEEEGSSVGKGSWQKREEEETPLFHGCLFPRPTVLPLGSCQSHPLVARR